MFRNLRNNFDFHLRNKIKFNRPLSPNAKIDDLAIRMQSELREFLDLFRWKMVLEKMDLVPGDPLVIGDIGTRTFVIAPVLDQIFRELNFSPEVHGFEVDAYRRFTNFRSRADYGHFYAMQIPKGEYHTQDFNYWNGDLHIALLLNPFVTEEPLLRWGLPRKFLRPEFLFDNTHKSLRKNRGILLVSSPTIEEYRIAQYLAVQSGFRRIQEETWRHSDNSLQGQPRYGALFI